MEKTKNQLKNEEKRSTKLEKFAAKQAKLAKQETVSKIIKVKEKSGEGFSEPKSIDETPIGEKKDLSLPMLPAYEPKAVEAAWYSWWEKSGFFKPECYGPLDGSREAYVVSLPPPNVTGFLHIGHAMMIAIQDTLVRWNRMKGKTTLYVPGCDHAGIATQIVVEKKLKKEKGLLRLDLGRELFVKEIWKWKEEHGDLIYFQLKSLGSSLDWDRKRFTLDSHMNEAVNGAFVAMFEKGLIFRENRLVNWCGRIKTSLSDLEVEHKTIAPNTFIEVLDTPNKKYEFGILTKFAYKLENSDDEIIVATTRPETILGDTAVAVNPNDERYKKFHGKFVIHPIDKRRIPIITDEHADMEFGTGALKITPAHDHADFEIGKKHGLEFINIFEEDNTLNVRGCQFAGMKRFDARIAVIDFLKKEDFYRGDLPHEIVLPICTRTGDIVEPRLKAQWWANCKSMAKEAVNAVKEKKITLFPEEAEKTWYSWLENIRDWCLSRQLWWGHRIPAYFVKIEGLLFNELDQNQWIIARSLEEAWEKVESKHPGIPRDKITLEQDPDVLDTWFSAGLWPFSILGWPNATLDMENFYPNQLLETGRDIIFFWVARMVMMGIFLTGKVPFKQVLLHSIVRDAHGRKMSKSLGNVVDPLDVIHGISLSDLQKKLDMGNLDAKEVARAKEGQKIDFPNGIPECGTDALRFTLCACMSQGHDVNLDIKRVDGYRRFCNKIWQACKFAMMKWGDDFVPLDKFCLTANETLADKWILSRLNAAIVETNAGLERYEFMSATSALLKFIRDELCDVYLEYSKLFTEPKAEEAHTVRRNIVLNILYTCVESSLRLLHPFMPFVTEELWQRLPKRSTEYSPSIVVSSYPEPVENQTNPEIEKEFELIDSIVRAIRAAKTEKGIIKGGDVIITLADADQLPLVSSQLNTIESLCLRLTSLKIGDTPSEAITKKVNQKISIHLTK